MSIFGYNIKGPAGETQSDEIKGTWFSCPEAGTATSITAYLYCAGECDVRYAIYKKSDGSLVGYTEEATIPTDYDDWKTLNIIWGGTLEATDYWLMQNHSYTYDGLFFYLIADEANKGGYENDTYNTFKAFITPDWYDNHKHSIYCTYTAEEEEGPPATAVTIQYKVTFGE